MHTKKMEKIVHEMVSLATTNSLVSAATYSPFIYSCQWLKSFEFVMICSTISQSFIDLICYSEAQSQAYSRLTTQLEERFVKMLLTRKLKKKDFRFLDKLLEAAVTLEIGTFMP